MFLLWSCSSNVFCARVSPLSHVCLFAFLIFTFCFRLCAHLVWRCWSEMVFFFGLYLGSYHFMQLLLQLSLTVFLKSFKVLKRSVFLMLRICHRNAVRVTNNLIRHVHGSWVLSPIMIWKKNPNTCHGA